MYQLTSYVTLFLSLPSDADWIYPSIIPSRSTSSINLPAVESTPPPQIPATDQQPATSSPIGVLPLTISLIIAVGITVVLIITVIALIAYVSCKSKPSPTKNLSGNHEYYKNYNTLFEFHQQLVMQIWSTMICTDSRAHIMVRSTMVTDIFFTTS